MAKRVDVDIDWDAAPPDLEPGSELEVGEGPGSNLLAWAILAGLAGLTYMLLKPSPPKGDLK